MAQRYDLLDPIVVNGINSMESYPDISPSDLISDNDSFHMVKSSDRFDLLANTYYNDPSLWYVILLANGMSLPTDLIPNTVIRIPANPNIINGIVKRKITVI